MSYMNRQRPPQNEQLQSFVSNVKREIDIFWTNILDEFNTVSTEISDKLNTIEKDHDKYRQKYGSNKYSHNKRTNNNHRSSLDFSNRENRNNKNNRNRRNKETDDTKYDNYRSQKEQYKKFAKNGNNISMGHGRTLSTMEIPTSFKLDPIEESILIIKPRAATTHCKDIYTTLLDENFYVTDFEEGRADASYFEKLWAKKYGYVSYFKELCSQMALDTFLVLKVFRVNAINELIDLCGHDDPTKAYNDNPNTLRAMFGQSVIQNAVYPAKNQHEVDQFNRDFFPKNKQQQQHEQHQQSLVVIKPNAAQQFGDVIRAHLIGQKFEIIQQKVFNLNAFVYSNMTYDAPDKYIQEIVDYMASGAVIALIVQKANVYSELERVVGDRDPEIAAHKQPESIRANYGENIVKNAIEYAGNYEIYKKNIPTFFFDVNIMNQAIDMNSILNKINNEQEFNNNNNNNSDNDYNNNKDEEQLELPEPNRDEGYAIVVIKPHVSSYQIEAIQDTFADNDIQINKQKSINMPIESIRVMLSIEYRNNEIIQLMANHLSSDEILVWLVSSKINNRNIFNILSNIIPHIRNQYGIDEIRDVMHYSTTNHSFKAIAHEFFFEFNGATPPKTPNMNLKLKSMDQIHQPIVDSKGNVTTELKHSRRLTDVKPFISQFTKEQKSVVLIKAHITKNQLFQIRKMLHDVSIEVIKEKQMSLPTDILYNVFEMDGYDDTEYHSMCQYISADEFIIWLVQRENVYEQLRYVIGPEDPRDAKQKYPQSIRAYYGLDKIRNAVYFSPNEHIYNHQVGIFFFEDETDNEDNDNIPHVPDVNDIDYISKKLKQHSQSQQQQQQVDNNNNNDDDDDEVLYGDDEYALILLSNNIISNEMILTQIKSRVTQNRFIIVDELNTYLPPTIVSEMFSDGCTSFSVDGPPLSKQEYDKLLLHFTSGEMLALHVCRQNGYMLLDQLRLELEQHNLICQIYITLSDKDYKSKCAHFFDSDESEKDNNSNNDNDNDYNDYNDNVTHTTQTYDNNERAIIIFKPNVTEEQKDYIRMTFRDEMLHIFDETQTYIPRKTLRDLLNHEGYDEYYMDRLCEFMAGHALEAWLIKGENVYKELMLIVGPEDSDVARVQAPDSIRAKYGIDKIQNVLYFTKNKQIFEQTHRYFFFDEPEINTNNNTIEINGDNVSSHSGSTSRRNNKPLQQQLEEFEQKSVLTAPKPLLMESDEEQRGILILQHYLNESEVDSIKIILDNNNIDIIQEKTSYLPMDTYKIIFEKSKPYWNENKINQMSKYYNQDECTAFLVAKHNLYNILPNIIGNENPILASKGTIRHLFGHDELQNVCFFTSNIGSYRAVVDELFFEHRNDNNNNNNKYLHSTNNHTSLMNIGAPTVTSVSSVSRHSDGTNSVTHTANIPSIKGIEKSILVFKPHMQKSDIKQINSMILNNNLNIIQQKICYLPSDVWYKCMKDEVVDDAHLAIEAQHLSSGPITAYLIMGQNVFDTIADLVGPSEPSVAKLHMPDSIRAKYGIDEVRNCCWWSKNAHTYKRIFHKFFFSEKIPQELQTQWQQQQPPQPLSQTRSQIQIQLDNAQTESVASSYKYSTSKYKPNYNRSETASISSSIRATDKTLLIIKPHVSSQDRQKIKDIFISNGIKIVQEKDTHLARESCKFLLNAEGYDQEYIEILSQELNKGELCALLLSKEGIFQDLKEIIGPSDPSIARKINPNSIRALYGKDIVKNCVYYTKSKRHYKKVFSFFFFVDVSEQPLDETGDADNSNSALLTANDNGQQSYTLPNNNEEEIYNDADADTVSVTSYGYHSHVYYNQCAPCGILIIKPHAMDKQLEIEQLLLSHDIQILAKRTVTIHSDAIYGFLKSNQTFNSLNKQVMNMIVDDMCAGNVCIYSVGDKNNKGFNKVEQGLNKIIEISNIISNKFGLDQIRNAIYCSRDVDEMRKQRKFFFLDSVFFKHESIEDSYQYSLMIIKPNAFKYRKKITQLLKSKEFNVVVNKKMNNMVLSLAQQFFYPYYNTNENFDEFCESMTIGEYVIIMVSRIGNCINALRQFTEQIQSMYATDDRSIAQLAVYTSQCETDFWRDRAFFFFNDEKSIQFQDNGSVSSFRSKQKSKNINKYNNNNNDTQSIHSYHTQQTVNTHNTHNTHLSEAFQLNPIEETILLIKPHAVKYSQDIERLLIEKGFFIAKARPMNMPTMVWEDFYRQYENKLWFNKLCSIMAEDQIKSYLLYRVNAIKYLRELVGPTDPSVAKIENTNCLRAIYGIDMIRNGFHCSRTEEDVIKERSELFFEDTTTVAENNKNDIDRIFVIIKPNCATKYGDNIRTHLVGKGFEIVKEKIFHLSETIYQNLSLDISDQYFQQEIKYLSSDQIIVMVIEKHEGYDFIIDVVGDRDPNIALSQQPDSIRAIYGKNIIENAIEISQNINIYKQNYDIFFDDDEFDNISDTHSYKMKKNKLKQRKLKLKSFQQQNKKDKCLLIIKPHINQQNINYIKQMLINLEFEIMSEKMQYKPYDEFVDVFQNDYEQNNLDVICREWSSGEITIFIISKLNVFKTIKTLVGPDDPEIARSEAPNSIRATFGIDRIRNCCWYSNNQKQYIQKLKTFEY